MVSTPCSQFCSLSWVRRFHGEVQGLEVTAFIQWKSWSDGARRWRLTSPTMWQGLLEVTDCESTVGMDRLHCCRNPTGTSVANIPKNEQKRQFQMDYMKSPFQTLHEIAISDVHIQIVVAFLSKQSPTVSKGLVYRGAPSFMRCSNVSIYGGRLPDQDFHPTA